MVYHTKHPNFKLWCASCVENVPTPVGGVKENRKRGYASHDPHNHVSGIFLIFLLSVLIPVISASAAETTPPAPTPTPAMSFPPERLAPPPTVYPPTQASQGAQVYYLVCMACHGDHGQGLTQEWLAVLDPGDRNCWQSHCHASNHPDEGFVLPKTIPAIIGPGKLDIFSTALDLHNYIQARMPWQAPGTLSEDEYWQLTAFLMQENGFDPGKQALDQELAAAINLGARPTPTATPSPGLTSISGLGFWATAAGVLTLAGFVILLAWFRQWGKH